MRVDWNSLKDFIDNTQLYRFVNYLEMTTDCYVWIYYEGESFATLLNHGSSDYETFNTEYKPKAILKNDLTEDGVRQTKTMFVGRSRMMHCLFVTFTTSIAQTNDDTGLTTICLKDINEQPVSDPSQAVYTEICFCPGVGIDYGLYGGGLETLEEIDTDIIADGILAPDIPAQYGGQVYFIRKRILAKPIEKFFRSAINVGEVPGSVPGANVLRIRLKHDAGLQKKFQVEIQYYI